MRLEMAHDDRRITVFTVDTEPLEANPLLGRKRSSLKCVDDVKAWRDAACEGGDRVWR